MKSCRECRKEIPSTAVVDGVRRRLSNRSKCLSCQPYGTSPYCRRYADGEERPSGAPKVRRWRARSIERTGECPISASRKARKRFVVNLVGGCCQFCQYSRSLRNLSFHHVVEKSFPMTERAFQLSSARILPEIRKCVLACHNCHGEIHDGLIGEERVGEAWSELRRALDGITSVPRAA